MEGRRGDVCCSSFSGEFQFSQAILVTVIIMNFAKAVVMAYTFWVQKSSTLVTIGDAISSFLCPRDPLTDSRCLMVRKDVGHGPLQWRCTDDTESLSRFRGSAALGSCKCSLLPYSPFSQGEETPAVTTQECSHYLRCGEAIERSGFGLHLAKDG